jgi:hypothetical protein
MEPIKNAFQAASEQHRPSIMNEFTYFLKTNKKWWLLPILLVIALLAFLAFFSGTGAAPFIYTVF